MIFADIEANGLTPDKIHCLWVKTKDGFKVAHTKEEFHQQFPDASKEVWVFHNGLGYDVKWLNKLWDAKINPKKVIDTFVVSRTLNYSRFQTHSLEELGAHVGVPKAEYTGGWDELTAEMEAYCIQDVNTTEAIWKYLSKDPNLPSCKEALRTEHDAAWLCQTMSDNGFPFDKAKAEKLLDQVTAEMGELEASFRADIPPRKTEFKRVKNRTKADGSEYSTVTKAKAEADEWELVGDEVVCYKYEHFSPSSPKQRIDVLWDYGWQPTEKTKGHYKWQQEKSRRFVR